MPAGSPLWEHDVGRAFHWVGQTWAAALDDVLGPTGPALVNRPSPRSTRASRPLWCFAELGHGEITVGASKVVVVYGLLTLIVAHPVLARFISRDPLALRLLAASLGYRRFYPARGSLLPAAGFRPRPCLPKV